MQIHVLLLHNVVVKIVTQLVLVSFNKHVVSETKKVFKLVVFLHLLLCVVLISPMELIVSVNHQGIFALCKILILVNVVLEFANSMEHVCEAVYCMWVRNSQLFIGFREERKLKPFHFSVNFTYLISLLYSFKNTQISFYIFWNFCLVLINNKFL